MNKNKKVQSKQQTTSVNYKHPLANQKIGDTIISLLPDQKQELVVMCIGTDRSTGDALGPLVGSLFSMSNPVNLNVYGTLHKPIHAINLNSYVNYINNKYDNPFIIAIDASLGRESAIGSLITGDGPIKPGAAVNKTLPPVGNIHLIAVVNIYNLMGHSVLQSTRLSLVYDMAITITNTLKYVDKSLSIKDHFQKVK